MPGIPGGNPYMYPPGTMYAAGYPTYLGYPTYAPMQYYPSLGAYSYAMQPAQLRPTIMIPVSIFHHVKQNNKS
nr:unnamed protein product [Callosobruchus analis]